MNGAGRDLRPEPGSEPVGSKRNRVRWPGGRRFHVVELDAVTCDLAAQVAEATQCGSLDALHRCCASPRRADARPECPRRLVGSRRVEPAFYSKAGIAERDESKTYGGLDGWRGLLCLTGQGGWRGGVGLQAVSLAVTTLEWSVPATNECGHRDCPVGGDQMVVLARSGRPGGSPPGGSEVVAYAPEHAPRNPRDRPGRRFSRQAGPVHRVVELCDAQTTSRRAAARPPERAPPAGDRRAPPPRWPGKRCSAGRAPLREAGCSRSPRPA